MSVRTKTDNKKTRFLITGGAGAIGSVIANELAKNSNNIIDVIDNLDSGFKTNLEEKKNLNFYEGSILDTDFLDKFEKNTYDYIFHLAALFANQTSIEQPIKDLQVNSMGTVRLLEMARKQKKLKKFLYTSSSCIYGNGYKDVMKETDIPKPETPYAVSKLTAEYYTNFYYRFYNIPTVTLRLFNIYGSNEYPGIYRNVIPNFVHRALNNLDLTIMGDGTDTRDFTHMNSAAEMLLGAAFDESNSGEIFNIGQGNETRIIDVAETIINGLGSKSKIIFVPKRSWDNIGKRKACVEKVKLYQKSPSVELKEGLINVYEFIDKIQPFLKDGKVKNSEILIDIVK